MKKRRNTSGGRAPPRGVSLQSQTAAFLAVHALAKRGVGKMFGVVEESCPITIKHETPHRVDDVLVVLSNSGRLFLQATRQPQPRKVVDFLRQATETYLAHKAPIGSEFKKALKRGEDALVLLVPIDARKNLGDLESACRKFDGFETWAEVALSGLTTKETTALTGAKATISATWKSVKGGDPEDDDLVELFGLIRTVRINIDPGASDERVVIEILRGPLGLSGSDASRAWDRLCRTNVEWMQNASGAGRDGISRHLKVIGIELEGNGAQPAQLETTVGNTQAGSTGGLAEQILAEAESRFPQHLADEELKKLIKRARQRLNFNDPTVGYAKEIAALAQRAIDGDLARASVEARWSAVMYAARSAAVKKAGVAEAMRLKDVAGKIAPSRGTEVLDAAIAMHQNVDAALKMLRDVRDPAARSQMVFMLKEANGHADAIAWVKEQGLTAKDFNSVGVHNTTIMALECDDVAFAVQWLAGASEEQVDESPSILALRADLTFASTLPADEWPSVVGSMPLDFRLVHPAEDTASIEARRRASIDLQKLQAIVKELGLTEVPHIVEERLIWLEGLDPAKVEAVKARIADGLRGDAARWVRLALRFDVPFDRKALTEKLDKLRSSGGWEASEGAAYLLMEMESGKPDRVARFIADNRERLVASGFISKVTLAVVEIQALAKSGDIANARRTLAEDIPTGHVESHQMLHSIIDECEGKVDPVTAARARYASGESTEDLKNLCRALSQAGQKEALLGPAVDLARKTRAMLDLRSAVRLLMEHGRYGEALKLFAEMPTVGAGDAVIEKLRAECQLCAGEFNSAQKTLEAHFSNKVDADVVHIWARLNIESGQWSRLQGLVDRAFVDKDVFSGLQLIQLAHLAREAGSGHVQELIDAALARPENDARVYMGAYTISIDQGREASDPKVFGWFERALQLSGDDGPIQRKTIRDVAAMAPAWRQQEERVNDMVRRSEVPLFIAARSLNVAFVNATLGRAIANRTVLDATSRSTILAFDGSRIQPNTLMGLHVVAVDISALMTVAYLGLAKTLTAMFPKVVIGAGTLGSLFEERQRVRFHQPSRIARAKRLRKLLDDGRLKVALPPSSVPANLSVQVGDELAGLLVLAKVEGGVVVRPGPIHQVGSLMEELAVLGEYDEWATDTRKTLATLADEGLLNSEVAESAATYINNADAGLPTARSVDAARNIYLDDLAVTYLEYTNVLPALCEWSHRVFIPPSVVQEADALIEYENHADKVLGCIEDIRAVLEKGLRDGSVVVADQVGKDESEDEAVNAPTMALLRSTTPVEAVVIDDKFVNHHRAWTSSGGEAKLSTTLDVLTELREREAISEQKEYQLRRDLREGGYQVVVIDEGELMWLLRSAAVKDGRLVESREMRMLRESVLVVMARKTLLAREEAWVNTAALAGLQVIRRIWADRDMDAAAKSDWLLDVLPDLAAFSPLPLDPVVWANVRSARAARLTLFFNTGSTPPKNRRAYAAWVEKSIVQPLKEDDPGLFAETLQRFKEHMKAFVDGCED